MLGSTVLLPAISAIGALIGLFIDPRKHRYGAIVLMLVIVGSAAATAVLNTRDAREAALKQQELQSKVDQLPSQVVVQMKDLLTQLRESGLPQSDVQRVQRSLDATQAIAPLTSAVRATASSRTIQYFPKNVDGDRVVAALQQVGYRVQTGRAVNDNPTNAIWVGENVSVDDAKFVALTLVKAGVGIRSIARFDQPGGAKANLIQVGSWAAYNSLPVRTVDEISRMSSVARSEAPPVAGN